MEVHEFRFAFHARDFNQSVQFYRDVLELTPIFQWDRPDSKGALLALDHHVVIEIYGAPEGSTYDGPSPLGLNLAIRLADIGSVDQFYETLAGRKAAVDGPPIDRPWGHRSFVVKDPDGIPIHYYCELS